MSASASYAKLRSLGLRAFETADAAAVLRKSTASTSQMLSRLEKAGLVQRLRPGLWLLSGEDINRYALLESLTAPFPSYVSLQTALYLHGMIEQVPAVIYAVSLDRTRRVRTTVGTYSVHHIAPELFEGFTSKEDGTKLATPEKALFDYVYLSGGRSHLFAAMPELELPKRLRRTLLKEWTGRIAAKSRRTMVAERLDQLLGRANRVRD